MRGTPNDSQDDLSGKRAPGAAPCPKETSQTCESFAAFGSLSRDMPPKTNKRVCEPSGDNVRWVDGWAVSRVRGRLRLASRVGTGAKGSTCASHRGSAASFRGSLQEFFLFVGVGFRKLGPRSLSATPEYVILAGICFPRSEACVTFGLLERVEPSKPSLVRAHSQAGALISVRLSASVGRVDWHTAPCAHGRS